MKTPYYVATVTDSYKAIDKTYNIKDLRLQLDTKATDPTRRLLFRELIHNHYNDGEYRRTCDFIAIALRIQIARALPFGQFL